MQRSTWFAPRRRDYDRCQRAGQNQYIGSHFHAGGGARSAQPSLEDMQKDRANGWTVLADIDGPTGRCVPVSAFAEGDNGKAADDKCASTVKMQRLMIWRALRRSLWLTPAMDRLFVDGAAGRRKFLDRFAQSLDVGLSAMGAYEKAMRERNRLLQTPDTSFDANSWLDGLEEEMALHGVALAAARLGCLGCAGGRSGRYSRSGFPRAEVRLEGSLGGGSPVRRLMWKIASALNCAARAACRCGAGRTLEGPHRSDPCKCIMPPKTCPQAIVRPASKRLYWSD